MQTYVTKVSLVIALTAGAIYHIVLVALAAVLT